MLITCTTCGTKIRVPDTSAGKRFKCPKCAALLTAAAAEDNPLEASVTPGPPPPLPPLPSARKRDEEEIEEDNEDRPSRRRKRDRDADEDDDEDRPSRRRLRDENDDEDEDDRPRRRYAHVARQNDNTSMGVTSLVCGIVAFPMLCCCSWLGLIPAIMAIVFGIIGISQGGRGKPMALTGLILGCVFFVFFVAFLILGFSLQMAHFQNQRFPFRQRF